MSASEYAGVSVATTFVVPLVYLSRCLSCRQSACVGAASARARVFVANADCDDVMANVQRALDSGKHVVFTPGIFKLDETIHVRHDNLVLLGIGLATLLSPSNGAPCVAVAPSVSGVRIAPSGHTRGQ